MNYPFDPHNTSSQNSRNQFMASQSSMYSSAFMGNQNNGTNPNEAEKIFNYMKNVMSNPQLMDQMQKFLSLKQSQKNSSFILKQNQSLSVSRMQTQLRQPPVSYTNESTFQHKPQPLRANPNPNVKKIKSPQMAPQISMRKKSQDGLMAYLSNENIEESQVVENPKKPDPKNYSDERPLKPQIAQQKYIKQQQKPLPKPKQPISFEDIPIKSTYIENGQFGNFNSGLAYPENQSQIYPNNKVKKPIKTSTSTKSNSNQNLKKNLDFEERPITGTKKDFKELLKEQCTESPFDEKPLPALVNKSQKNLAQYDQYQNQHENQDQNQQQNKPKRQFLKRGSRQYLSSAIDKKPVQKKPTEGKNRDSQQNLNSSRLGITNTERDKTPTKRDLSQNRVLSKRNTVNDKSVTKLKTQGNVSNSYEKDQDEPQRTVTSKNQRVTQKSKTTALPPKNTKVNISNKPTTPNGINAGSGKKKNVFDDSSSQDGEGQNQSNQQQNDEDYSSKRSENAQKQKKYSSYQPEKEFNMLSREKKEEIIEGVYLTRSQLNTILQRYAPSSKTQPTAKNANSSEQKFNQLRKKYTDLCNLLQKQKIQHEEQMETEKQQFQTFKQQQIQKLKNQRRVMERQIKSSMPSQGQNHQKDKEQVQNLKKQLEKEREQHKKKQKNNKILIEKYKKQNQDLKFRLQKVQEEIEKQSQSSVQNNFSSTHSQKNTPQISQRPSTSIHDKSKSKPTTKDLSPGKTKMSKSSKTFEQNEEENEQDKNYKKTVPLYKQGQEKKPISPSINQNSKKGLDKGAKFINEDQNSDDDNLPTFKVDNKKVDDPKGAKTQKKYQFIENSVEQNQNKKQVPNKNSSNHRKTGSKNVFVDESDSDHNHDDQSDNQNSENEGGQKGNFFKPQSKYEKLSDLMSSNFSIKEVSEEMIQNLLRFENNSEYKKYLQRINNPKRMIVNSSKNGVDKKITNIYNDKSKEILFENGVKKEIFEDGYTIIYFKNGDIKQKLEDGTTLYYFNDKKVDQITLVNGLNIYRFDNNQVEIHYDGNKYIEIRNPDGTIKMLGSPIH